MHGEKWLAFLMAEEVKIGPMNSHQKLASLKARMNRQARNTPPPSDWRSRAERILIGLGLLTILLGGLATAWVMLVVLR